MPLSVKVSAVKQWNKIKKTNTATESDKEWQKKILQIRVTKVPCPNDSRYTV